MSLGEASLPLIPVSAVSKVSRQRIAQGRGGQSPHTSRSTIPPGADCAIRERPALTTAVRRCFTIQARLHSNNVSGSAERFLSNSAPETSLEEWERRRGEGQTMAASPLGEAIECSQSASMMRAVRRSPYQVANRSIDFRAASAGTEHGRATLCPVFPLHSVRIPRCRMR